MKLSIFLGDIADAPVDALCTSTNPRLSLMMGTGASVRSRGGQFVVKACNGLAPLPAGAVHVTSAGALPHQVVIHCVASDGAHRSSVAIVRACVVHAFAAAEAAGCATIAMPLFGTGHARLRFVDVARVMARTALELTTSVQEVKFVTNVEDRLDELRDVLLEIAGSPIDVVRSPQFEEPPASLWSNESPFDFDIP